MEEIRDRKLNIVGERYRSFLEAYRENDARSFNAASRSRGDGDIFAPVEVKKGTFFRANETRQALLYGSDIFQEEFREMRLKATEALKDRYEWREVQSADTSVHGQNVIVERFVAGHPEAFRRSLPKTRKKRSVHIVYDSMCAASTSVRRRVRAGCAVMAAVEALEKIGYEVAVSIVLAKYSGGPTAQDPTLLMEVSLKDYGEPFNERKMQFPLASKSVLFHLGCWWAHRFPRTPMDYGIGEGYPLSYNKGRVRAMEAYAAKTGGAYLSEDIIEISLQMDPVKVLQRVLGAIGAEEELTVHLKGKRPMGIAAEPEQGKIFHDWSPDGMSDPQGPESISLAPKLKDSGSDEDENPRMQAQPGAEDLRQEQAQEQEEADEENGEEQEGADQDAAEKAPEASGGSDASDEGDAGDSPAMTAACSEVADSGPSEKTSRQNDADEEEGGSQGGDGKSQSSGSDPSYSSESGGAEDGPASDQKKPGASTGNGAGDAEDDEEGGEENANITKCEEEEEPMAELTSELENAMKEEPASDEFIIALRKRFVSFENGDYLNAMIEDKMARRRAAKQTAPGAPAAPAAPMAPGFNPNGRPDDPGFRAFAAFACK